MFLNVLPRWVIGLIFRSFEAREVFLSQVEELLLKNPGRPVAFASFSAGFVEFLAIRVFLAGKFGQKFELRLATRVPSLFIEPFSIFCRRVLSLLGFSIRVPSRIKLCADELRSGRPVFLCFETTERTRSFEIPRGESELAYLKEEIPDLLIVPLVFIWRRKRNLEAGEASNFTSKLWRNFVSPISSPWQLLLGDPYRPTGLRKLLIMLRQYARSTLRVCSPIPISESAPRPLRRKILFLIQQEKKIILGPVYRSTRLINESVLRSPGLRELIQRLSAEEGVPETDLFKKAQKHIGEIAAVYSYFVIEICGYFLHKVFTTIFEDVTIRDSDFEKVRDAAREGALVYLPSHKSYVDFLLLSYLLHRKEIFAPHVAAGANMNFWPMGKLFRGGGAFFIRRSFRGKKLYAEVLKRYIVELLSNRVSLEFFIEGKRSRSGKLLPPKFGMLSMISDAVLKNEVSEKVFLVPVSITYDRVTEERAHKREMEGGAKVQESALGVLRAFKVLFRSFGKVHVRMADPIELRTLLGQTLGEGERSLDTKKLGVQKAAFEVCHRINTVTPLTSFGVVCTLLLSKPGAAMSRSDFENLLNLVKQDFDQSAFQKTPELENNFFEACRRALGRLKEDGIVVSYETPLKTRGIRIPEKQRMAALFYKNGVSHAFVTWGIKALSNNDPAKVLYLRSLLEFEFFFAEKDQFLRELQNVPSNICLNFYGFVIDDVLETICGGIEGLLRNSKLFFDLEEWKTRLLKFGQTKILEDTILRPEGINTQGFSAFVELAKHKGWLRPSPANPKLFTPQDGIGLQDELARIKRLRFSSEDWSRLKEQYFSTELDFRDDVGPARNAIPFDTQKNT